MPGLLCGLSTLEDSPGSPGMAIGVKYCTFSWDTAATMCITKVLSHKCLTDFRMTDTLPAQCYTHRTINKKQFVVVVVSLLVIMTVHNYPRVHAYRFSGGTPL